jgi:hypothetical protein
MAKERIVKLDPAALIATYPIANQIAGWFFRIEETSMGAYLVEGTDLWGRKVRRDGHDPDVALNRCVEDAVQIIASSNAA